LALVAAAILGIVAMAGLSIDVGTLYQASAEAQRAADAAALAAARVLSSTGLTGDPTNSAGTWSTVCANATQVAQTVAIQNTVGGSVLLASAVSVTYSAGSAVSAGVTDCSTLGFGFGVNPVVTVDVTQSNLPTYFSRIWGRTGRSVSATAMAEVFNPSNSNSYSGGDVVPVQPRCVKPWLVPNFDPLNSTPEVTPPNYCSTAGNPACNPLVTTANGSIFTPGILANGSGVIGETFWLMPDCNFNPTPCVLRSTPPQANYPKAGKIHVPFQPSLEYLPGQVPSSSSAFTAIPACSTSAAYAQAIAGCDQSTQYQCGQLLQNAVDLSENPAQADTANGAQCLIHQGTSEGGYSWVPPLSGQDALQPVGTAPPPSYPFQIQVGSSNPLLGVAGVGGTDVITSSTSIVSLPIYDSTAVTAFTAGGTTSVTVIGFLQVFINSVNAYGNLNVTVMNVSGCGNGQGGTTVSTNPLFGTSPVPIRLITPP
jgi:hypothetical protein